MTGFELPKLTFKALIESKYAVSYSLIWLFMTAIMFWKQTLMATILTSSNTTDTTQERQWFAGLILVIPFIEYGIFGNYISKIGSSIKTDIYNDILLEYKSLSIEAKETFNHKMLQNKFNGAEWGIAYWIESGFPTFFQLISSLYLCVYTFYKTDMMTTFYVLIVINIVLYKYVKQYLDERQSNVWKENNKKRDKNTALSDLYFSRYMYGQCDKKHVLSNFEEKCSIKTNFDRTRNEQKLFTGMLSEVCMVITLLFAPSMYVLTYLTVTMQFTGMMRSIFGVMNSNTHFESEWQTLREKFDKYQKQEDIILQHPLGDGFFILQYTLSKSAFSLDMKGHLNITVGNIVIVQGASGSGKTTWLKGVFGYCNDAKVVLSNNLQPNNYHSLHALMYQNIKEKTNIQNLTLREIFNNTPNINLIQQVLDYACVGSWVARLKSKANKQTSDCIVNIDEIQELNGDYISVKIKYEKETKDASWVDIDLSQIGTLSGGEKTRLLLALQLFECITKNKKILILDEPEQGTDPEIAYKMIKNIVDNFSSTLMIVIISHLERFGGHNDMPNTSGIYFKQKVFVKDGIVTVTNC